jgi:hypothetical protein
VDKNEIQSGDILCWQGLGLFGKVIKLVTRSQFTHVGIAYRSRTGEMLIADAMIMRGVTITNLAYADQKFWRLPIAGLELEPDALKKGGAFVIQHVGLPYSLKDCFWAAIRQKTREKGYQCAEFVRDYLDEMGVNTGIKSPTPANIIAFMEARVGPAQEVL